VQALHGDMDQPARTAALEQFRKNEVTLLVASDVAARGLDIPEVSHIYNFDVPVHPDDYVHRIGRTGRAGRTGTAITLVAGSNDAKAVAAIEKLIGQPIPWMDVPGAPAAAVRHAASAPRQETRQETRQENRQENRQEHRQEKSHGTHRRGRPDGHRKAQRPAASASIARIPQRPPQPSQSRPDDGDASHLPAFLLRPVTLKA
jgi:superfamily II DNA/RNA helicase